MRIELQFANLSEDLKGASIRISVQEHSEEDAPPQSLLDRSIGPVTVHQREPAFLVDIESAWADRPDIRLIVQISADAGGRRCRFLNTTEITLSGHTDETIRVPMSRIA